MATAATASQLATIRQWCGSDVGADGDQFDAIDIAERLDACGGSANAVALQVLRQRRADLVNAGKVSVDGDFDHDPKDSIAALSRDIASLESLVAAEGGLGTASTSLMVRRTDRAGRCR